MFGTHGHTISVKAAHLICLNNAVVPDLVIIVTTLTIIDAMSGMGSLFFLYCELLFLL